MLKELNKIIMQEQFRTRSYTYSLLIEQDGSRPWHERTASVDREDGRSFKLWIGKLFLKERVRPQNLQPAATFEEAASILAPANAFGNIFHRGDDGCGWAWIGISRFPHSEGWTRSTAKWDGWAHLVHFREQKETTAELVTEVFETTLQLLYESGYPQNLRKFTSSLIESLGTRVGKHPGFEFPLVDPRVRYRH